MCRFPSDVARTDARNQRSFNCHRLRSDHLVPHHFQHRRPRGRPDRAGGALSCGRKAKTAQLYAICDAAEDLLERMAAVHQPSTTFADYDAMLADDNIDAVIIAVADQFHVALAIKALDAGKHVLVEKPMAITVEDAEALLEAAETSDRVVLVGHEKRYDPGVAFAHDFIRDEIGELIGLKHWYCDSTYRYSMTDTLQPIIESSSAARRPPGDPKADRQRYFVLGHGSHMLDTARYLGGPMVAIRARLSTRLTRIAGSSRSPTPTAVSVNSISPSRSGWTGGRASRSTAARAA